MKVRAVGKRFRGRDPRCEDWPGHACATIERQVQDHLLYDAEAVLSFESWRYDETCAGMALTSFPLHVPEGRSSTFQTPGHRVAECGTRARGTHG